jgi:hypothetical protein
VVQTLAPAVRQNRSAKLRLVQLACPGCPWYAVGV